MRILTDTNVLLRLAEPTHALHAIASEATERLREAGHDLAVVPQNIYEFWVVATRTQEANGLGKPVEEAEALVGRLVRLFTVLRDERAVFEYWNQLVVAYGVKGVKAHDTRLVAAMHRHEVSHILTFNDSDFNRYSEITVLTPAGVVAGAGTKDAGQ